MSINPTNQNVMELFSINKQYLIDFYQRDYQWKKEHMDRLLEDLFYRFSMEYRPNLDVNEENISQFDWYYLNAYVTNDYKGKTYIVDGQQRLTSLTLILIKLYHLAEKYDLPHRKELVKEHIMGTGISGYTYWMGINERKSVLEDLFINDRQTITKLSNDISISNLYKNYDFAGRKLVEFLNTSHKFESFLIYFLTRVNLVRIHIQDTKDVPMVFEVINDRGERLKPYEVLKGKLLGQIDKNEIEKYHNIWQKHIHCIQGIDEKEVDTFFRFFFRAKYVETHADYREFDGDYHKTIFEDKWNNVIGFKQNVNKVKDFILNDLNYFAQLYLKILQDSKRENPEICPHLLFNDLNDQDRQFLLILSSCAAHDEDEIDKIRVISRLFDKHFTLLQLTGSYDSNTFTESIISLNKRIRSKSIEEIENVFNEQILKDISDSKGVEIKVPLEWNYFRDASNHNLGIRFIRYYFSRIEHFIAGKIGKTTESYYNLVRNTGPKYGYHIEHIIADNEENRYLFQNDEELFLTERNKLGALLLLKGRDNQSSGNEVFAEKLKTYSGTLLWNQTLCSEFYHKKIDFRDFIQQYELEFKTYDSFNYEAIMDRQKLLFKLTKLIWD